VAARAFPPETYAPASWRRRASSLAQLARAPAGMAANLEDRKAAMQ
jgi:hypothetical protein